MHGNQILDHRVGGGSAVGRLGRRTHLFAIEPTKLCRWISVGPKYGRQHSNRKQGWTGQARRYKDNTPRWWALLGQYGQVKWQARFAIISFSTNENNMSKLFDVGCFVGQIIPIRWCHFSECGFAYSLFTVVRWFRLHFHGVHDYCRSDRFIWSDNPFSHHSQVRASDSYSIFRGATQV